MDERCGAMVVLSLLTLLCRVLNENTEQVIVRPAAGRITWGKPK